MLERNSENVTEPRAGATPAPAQGRAFAEEAKDPLRDVEWKNMSTTNDKVENGQPITKKRLPKKIRQIPECYFLPRKSIPSAIAFYGSFIVAGVGAGMLWEVWINKKVKRGWRYYLGVQQMKHNRIDCLHHIYVGLFFI